MIQENVSLLPFNTFKMDVRASRFAVFSSIDELRKLLVEKGTDPLFVLGGGSNILLTEDYHGLVLKNEIKGIELLNTEGNEVFVKVGAGEIWHEFVLEAIENGWAGIENMSLIPGTVGAAPIQNIGAYGVELKDVFFELSALNLSTSEIEVFKYEDCEFGYRDSVFKRHLKGKYIIVDVTLRLSKEPIFKTSYGDIQSTLEAHGVKELSIKAVSDAVVEIRQSKLPDPAVIGNGGSFFKNPEIPTEQYEEVKKKFPEMPGYKITDTITKVPAGWLIDQAGWKGRTFDSIGVHKKQALVLVNYGGGNGNAIYDLALQIKKSVKEKYGIEIIPEVNVI